METRTPNPFETVYAKLFDEELLSLAEQTDDLLPEARAALRSEITRRGLEKQAARRERKSRAAALAARIQQPDPSGLIPVFSAKDEAEARLVQSYLETAGMESVLQAHGLLVLWGSCEVLVLESQAEEARLIVAEYLETKPLPEPQPEPKEPEDPGLPEHISEWTSSTCRRTLQSRAAGRVRITDKKRLSNRGGSSMACLVCERPAFGQARELQDEPVCSACGQERLRLSDRTAEWRLEPELACSIPREVV